MRGVFLDDFIVGRQESTERTWRAARRCSETIRRAASTEIRWQADGSLGDALHPRDQPAAQDHAPAFRGCEPPLAAFLDQFDVLTLWTWNSDELRELEENLAALEKIAPKKARIALGLYIWDYHNGRPVPKELMQHQCDLGLKWLKEGRSAT